MGRRRVTPAAAAAIGGLPASAEAADVSGRVTASNGDPVAGATIRDAEDIDGFRFDATPGNYYVAPIRIARLDRSHEQDAPDRHDEGSCPLGIVSLGEVTSFPLAPSAGNDSAVPSGVQELSTVHFRCHLIWGCADLFNLSSFRRI